MTHYASRLPCDASRTGRFRSAIGEAGVEELLKATMDTAVAAKAIKPAELERVIVDTTVREKAIAHPADSRLLEIARHKVVSAAKRCAIALKQTFAKEGQELRRKAGGYAHARQFKRLRKTLKRQRTAAWTTPAPLHARKRKVHRYTPYQLRRPSRAQALAAADRLANVFSTRLGMLGTWSTRTRQRRDLAALDDRLLRDVGLSRETALREAEKPFWRR